MMDPLDLCRCDTPRLDHVERPDDPHCVDCDGLVPIEVDEHGDRTHNIEVAQAAAPYRPTVVHAGSFGDFTHVGRDGCRCRPQVLRPKMEA